MTHFKPERPLSHEIPCRHAGELKIPTEIGWRGDEVSFGKAYIDLSHPPHCCESSVRKFALSSVGFVHFVFISMTGIPSPQSQLTQLKLEERR